MGKKKNSIVGKKKGSDFQVIACYLQLSASMGKTPYFWSMWSASFSNLAISLLMYNVCL